MQQARRFWGWGVEGEGPSAAQQRKLGETIAARFGGEPREPIPPPTLDELDLPAPRVAPPASLASVCTDDPFERASHTYGKSFRDVWRALHRDFSCPPDLVAIPRDEADIISLLDWCCDQRIAAVPYGGGSSVVGGIECDIDDDYQGAISIDMRALDQVLEVDRVSRAARIQAGVYGPALEDQLRPHGLTLRHFPQSFEFSTLGGWLATRSGGHYATLHTHIDDFVESIRAITPRGDWESRRLPGSGAGPSPDRALLGSEGILGIITEAWMRLQDRPTFRASATARFATFDACRRGRARDLAERPLSRELPAARRRRSRAHRRRRLGRRAAPPRVRVGRSSARGRGSRARSSASAITVASSPTRASRCATAVRPKARATAPRDRGATRSSARRTRATRSSGSARSRRRSRPRAPGTRSRRCTTR